MPTTASELVQLNVARALNEALRANRGNGSANQETAAMRGVIEFLKSYMKNADATATEKHVLVFVVIPQYFFRGL